MLGDYSDYSKLDPSEHRYASVDENVRPGNVAACLTSQKYNSSSQLFWFTHPAKRVPFSPNAPMLCEPLSLVQDRIHIPRADAVDSDPEPRPLGCQRALDGEDGRLGRVVVNLGLGEVDNMCRYARHEDDATAGSPARHGLCHRPSTQEGTRGVDVKHLPPLLRRDVEGMSGKSDAGEAEAEIDGADFLFRPGDRCRDACSICHIDLIEGYLCRGELGLECLDRRLACVRVEVEDGEAF